MSYTLDPVTSANTSTSATAPFTITYHTKAEEPHTHEVPLPDGQTVMSGPAIPASSGGSAVPGGEVALPPGQLRAPEKAKTGAAEPLPEGADQIARVRAAVASGRLDLLPPEAIEIWKRMVDSGLRFFSGESSRRPYVEQVAWRAVRQNYGLEESHAQAPQETQAPAPATLRAPPKRVKYVLAGGTTPRPAGGGWVVPIAENAADDTVLRGGVGKASADAWYDEITSLDIPGQPGSSVRVGTSGNGHINILDVTVPRRLVASNESGAGAVKWVRDHWHAIYNTAKGIYYRDGIPTAKRQRFVKFVLTPEKAVERIAYGAVYVPWEIDLQGEFSTAENVLKMAHRFMEQRGDPKEMHASARMKDGTRPYEIVESFVSRDNDPHFIPGSWVMGVRFHPDVWQKVAAGEYRGFSIGGRWGRNQLAPELVAA